MSRSDKCNMENFSLVKEGRGKRMGFQPGFLKTPLQMEFRIIFTRKKCQSGLKIQNDFTAQLKFVHEEQHHGLI